MPLKRSLEVLFESSDASNTDVQHVLVYKRTDAKVFMKPGRDEWLEEVCHLQLYTLITFAIRLVAILIAKIDQLSCMLSLTSLV